MQAEDLHVANLLQMGNPVSTYFHQYGWGEKGRYVTGHHALEDATASWAVDEHRFRLVHSPSSGWFWVVGNDATHLYGFGWAPNLPAA